MYFHETFYKHWLESAVAASFIYSGASCVTIKTKTSPPSLLLWHLYHVDVRQKHTHMKTHTQLHSQTGSTPHLSCSCFSQHTYVCACVWVCVRSRPPATVGNRQEADWTAQEKKTTQRHVIEDSGGWKHYYWRGKHEQKIIQRERNRDSDQVRKMWLWNNAGGQNVFCSSILLPFLSYWEVGLWLDSGSVHTDNIKKRFSESFPFSLQDVKWFQICSVSSSFFSCMSMKEWLNGRS